MKHYAYGSGMVGCLFDNGPHFAETLDRAIDGVLFIFDDLPEDELENARSNLRNDGIHYFSDPIEAGAQCCEITEMDGPCPEED